MFLFVFFFFDFFDVLFFDFSIHRKSETRMSRSIQQKTVYRNASETRRSHTIQQKSAPQ